MQVAQRPPCLDAKIGPPEEEEDREVAGATDVHRQRPVLPQALAQVAHLVAVDGNNPGIFAVDTSLELEHIAGPQLLMPDCAATTAAGRETDLWLDLLWTKARRLAGQEMLQVP